MQIPNFSFQSAIFRRVGWHLLVVGFGILTLLVIGAMGYRAGGSIQTPCQTHSSTPENFFSVLPPYFGSTGLVVPIKNVSGSTQSVYEFYITVFDSSCNSTTVEGLAGPWNIESNSGIELYADPPGVYHLRKFDGQIIMNYDWRDAPHTSAGFTFYGGGRSIAAVSDNWSISTIAVSPTATSTPSQTPTPGNVVFFDDFNAENGGVGQLNYTNFNHWTVTRGSVDLVACCVPNWYPNDGEYVDMDGTTFAAGRLTSNVIFLIPGTYDLEFDLGYNHDGAGGTQNNNMSVSVGSSSIGEFSMTDAGDTAFNHIFRSFQVTTPQSVSIVFDHAGGDNQGLIIDNVKLTLETSGSCVAPPSGMVAWWRAEGNANDSIGSNNGTMQNGAGFVSGMIGQGFNFNGNSQYALIPHSGSINPATAITVEGWIKVNALPLKYGAAILTKDSPSSGPYHFPLEPNGSVAFNVFTNEGGWQVGAASPPGSIVPGQFIHVAGSYDSVAEQLCVYANGTPSCRPTQGTMNQNSNPVKIGHAPFTNTFFDGVIDELSIYNRALSQDEIQSIYNSGSAGKCSATPPTQTSTPTVTPTPSSGPFVTSVQRTYSGYFLSGFNADNIFNVGINWGGAPGSVRFQVNNGTPIIVPGTTAGVVRALNMNSDFIPSFSPSVVKITPTNGQNVTGPTWTGNVYIFPYPTWLPSAVILAGNGEMKAKFELRYPSPPINSMEVSIPQWVPFLGGEFGVKETQAIVKGSVSSAGTGSLSVGGRTGFKAMENEVAGSLVGTGNFLLNQNGLRPTGASLDFELKGNIGKEIGVLQAIPSLKPFSSVPILRQFNQIAKLRGEIEPQINVMSNWSQNPSTGQLKFDSLTGTGTLKLKGILKMNATKHLSAQGWVGGGGSVTFGLPEPYLRSMRISAEAGVKLTVNGLFTTIKRSLTYEFACGWTAGSSAVTCGAGSSTTPRNLESSRLRLKLLHRPYDRFGVYENLVKRDSSQLSTQEFRTSHLTQESPFLTNIFPGAEPNFINVGTNGRMLLYVRQNTMLPILQSTEIAWSYFDGTNWSSPAVISSDTRAEMSSVVGVDENGKVVAAWLRIKDAAYAGSPSTFEELPDFYKKLEVVTAVFDPAMGTWSAVTQLTDDLALDTSLRLSSDATGKLLLTWQSNPSGEFTADAANPASLKYTFWNGSAWNPVATVATGLVNINEHAATVYGSDAFIVVPQDPDLNVTGDRTLLVYVWNGASWSSSSIFAAGGVDNLNPSAAYDAGGQGHVVWLRGSDIVHATLASPTPQLVRAGSDSMAFFSLQFINNVAGNMTLVWHEASDQGPANIFATIYDTVSHTWSADLKLNDDDWQASDTNGYYGTDGKLYLAYLATHINRITQTVTIDGQPVDIPNIPEDGQTDLRILDYTLATDLAVVDNDLSLSSLNPQPDDVMTAEITIHNVGAYPVSNFNLKLFAGDASAGTLLDTVRVNTQIPGGSARNISFEFNYPASALTFTVVVDSDNEVAENSEINNVAVATITAPLPTPTAPPASLSGVVSYGNALASPKFISNVTVTGIGSPTVTITTEAPGDTGGQYTLTGFGSGSYTISLSKTTGQNGINSFDAARIAQAVAGVSPFTNDNQRVSADVSGNGVVSSQDAAKLAQFVAGITPLPAPNLAGQWKFFVTNPTFPIGSSPTSRTYASVTSNITGDDYVGLLLGEVTGNWTPSAARPSGGIPHIDGQSQKMRGPVQGEQPIALEFGSIKDSLDKEIAVPIRVKGVADKDVISYEFDLRYDPSVIQPVGDAVDLKDTVSRGLSVVVNTNEPGLLRVVVYGAYPIDGDGVLLNLRFMAVGVGGSISNLKFENLIFNEGEPRVSVANGELRIEN